MKATDVNALQLILAKRKPADLNGPFNDWIYEAMQLQGIESLEEFSRRSGISRGTIYHLVRGRVSPKGTWVKPSIDTLVALAIFLNRPIQELIFRLEPNAPGSDIFSPLEAASQVQGAVAVPIVGVVGAGPGQAVPIRDGVMYVPPDVAKGRVLEGYRVLGDSMCAGRRPICSGDLVAVNKLDKGKSGQAVVARLADDSYVCKALKVDKFGKRLMSTNALYTNSAPPIITADMVAEIIGRVVYNAGEVEDLEEA
ncbi:MAG: LexA family transcriptional regulator [Meiothermus sp.]|nr:LexA family transcriptional regulator [Meiothermus sp.]